MREHPRFAEQIPHNAVVILQFEGDKEFNRWARQLAESRQEEGTSLSMVKIKKLKPLRSRIEQIQLEQTVHPGS